MLRLHTEVVIGQDPLFDHSESKSYLIRSFDMNFDNKIPVVVGHILEADISQDARIVQEYVDPAELIDCRVDDPISVLNAVIIGNSLAASGTNLIYDKVGSLQDTVSWSRPVADSGH